MNTRLILGTAQLGMPYGVANKNGQPVPDLAKKIVKIAWEDDIREFDTAQGYGDSENVLGQAIRAHGLAADIKIVTKLKPGLNHLDYDALEQAVTGSLRILGIPRLHGLMLHRESFLDQWQHGLGENLQGLVSKGLVEKIGVSVYSPGKALRAMDIEEIDLVQIPSNVFDRRFEEADVFRLAVQRKIQIHVRSVFLQGLALMPASELPPHMTFALPVIQTLAALCREAGVTRQALALGYVRQAYPNTGVLIGVETPGQLEENLAIWHAELPDGMLDQVVRTFSKVDERILNPAWWGS